MEIFKTVCYNQFDKDNFRLGDIIYDKSSIV